MENKEVELKFEIPAHDVGEYFSLIVQKGGIHRFSGYEISEMYDLHGMLHADDARLRLRKTKLLEGNEQIIKLTYKKPVTREGIKVEIEHETTVGDYQKMVDILHAINFQCVSSYEKIRHSFAYKNVVVEIDVYSFASFIEIEGAEDSILSVAEDLGFVMKDNLTDSCDTIDDKRRKAQGLPSRDHVIFDDFNAAQDEQIKILQNSK